MEDLSLGSWCSPTHWNCHATRMSAEDWWAISQVFLWCQAASTSLSRTASRTVQNTGMKVHAVINVLQTQRSISSSGSSPSLTFYILRHIVCCPAMCPNFRVGVYCYKEVDSSKMTAQKEEKPSPASLINAHTKNWSICWNYGKPRHIRNYCKKMHVLPSKKGN